VIGLVERYKKRIRPELFTPRVDWRVGGKGIKAPQRRLKVAVAASASSRD